MLNRLSLIKMSISSIFAYCFMKIVLFLQDVIQWCKNWIINYVLVEESFYKSQVEKEMSNE